MGSEKKLFDINDIINHVSKKLVDRHPHVFGDKKADASFEAKQNWESIKHKEKKRKFGYTNNSKFFKKKEGVSSSSDENKPIASDASFNVAPNLPNTQPLK